VERWAVEPDLAHLLAHLASGRIGRAVTLAQNPDLLAERESRLESLYEFLEGSRVKRFAAADRLARDPEALSEILQLWLGFWRDLVLSAIVAGDDRAISNVDQIDRLARYARTWPSEAILNSLRRTEEALWQLERNANTRLVLENLLLTYPREQQLPV
jgi:DNA polymerase-3 subunit delta'